MEIKAKCRRLKQKHGSLDLVVIDYLQLMKSGGRAESRQVEVSDMSRNLKLMAKELGVPVVVLSQLNRGPEQRTDRRPVISDLRESGAIEQDADMVILLHREDAYEKDSPRGRGRPHRRQAPQRPHGDDHCRVPGALQPVRRHGHRLLIRSNVRFRLIVCGAAVAPATMGLTTEGEVLMTQTETTERGTVRAAGEQILQAGGMVGSRADLLDFLSELSSVGSAIRHALANAAWRGQLSDGAPLDERPPIQDLEERLTLRDLGGRTPGEGVLSLSILNAMRAARSLGDLANTAWTAAVAEDTRVGADEARAKRDRDSVAEEQQLLEAVLRVLETAVPEQARGEVAAELRRELAGVWQQRGKRPASAPVQD